MLLIFIEAIKEQGNVPEKQGTGEGKAVKRYKKKQALLPGKARVTI